MQVVTNSLQPVPASRAKTGGNVVKKLNLIGQQIVKLRQHHGWTQEEFAGQLQRAGWHNATRSTVSKIEGGLLCVTDYDVLIIAAALKVSLTQVYPEINWQRPMDETIHTFIPEEIHGLPLEP